MPSCSAPNCSQTGKGGIRLYIFPKESTRRAKWLQNCRRDMWQPTKHSRLCEKHFEESQYETKRQDGWKKLKPNAVPTIFDAPNCPSRPKRSRCPPKPRQNVKKHFEESQYEAKRQDGWKKLKPNAVPTIFDAPNCPSRPKRSRCPPKPRQNVKKHFEESQYEAKRQDGWKKLKPNAVPTIFDAPNCPSRPKRSRCPPKPRQNVKVQQLPEIIHDQEIPASDSPNDIDLEVFHLDVFPTSSDDSIASQQIDRDNTQKNPLEDKVMALQLQVWQLQKKLSAAKKEIRNYKQFFNELPFLCPEPNFDKFD